MWGLKKWLHKHVRHKKSPKKFYGRSVTSENLTVEPLHTPLSTIIAANNIKYNASCCVFRPAFGGCAHLKAGQNSFLSHFQRTPSGS